MAMLLVFIARAGTAPAFSGRGGPEQCATYVPFARHVCLFGLAVPIQGTDNCLALRATGWCCGAQCTAWAGPSSAPLLKVKAKAKSKGLVENQYDQQ